ncbi:hypothetical protein D3C72_2257960 [compost metagenome]
MEINKPSDGSVIGTPTPRNDSVASSAIAVAIWMVANTMTGPRQLGSRWKTMMRQAG